MSQTLLFNEQFCIIKDQRYKCLVPDVVALGVGADVAPDARAHGHEAQDEGKREQQLQHFSGLKSFGLECLCCFEVGIKLAT